MIFSRSLFFVDHIQKSFLTKPTHTISCTTSSSDSEETSSQSSKNKRREKVFMATGFPSTSILCLSVSSGERLASNRSLFAKKWTIVALFWSTRNPRQNLLGIGLSLQFPSISKQKKVALIFYTFLRVCGIRMNMILTWLPYPGLPSYSVKNLSCWLSFPLHSLISSCPPTRRNCQLPRSRSIPMESTPGSCAPIAISLSQKNQGHLGGTIGHHNQLLHQNGHFAVVTHHISGIISPQKYMACMVPRK